MTAYEIIEKYDIETLDGLKLLMMRGVVDEEDAEIIAGIILGC